MLPFMTDANGRRAGATFLRNSLGKRSIGIDLKRPEGRELVLALAPRFDIFAENFKAGALAKLGLGYDEVAKVYPSVIYLSVSGFGNLTDSPYSHWPAYASIAEAMSGLYEHNRRGDDPPFVGPAGVSLTPLRAILRDPSFSKAFLNTLIVIAVAGTSAVLLGALFAWLNERTDGNFGVVSGIAPLVPLLIPPVAMALGWMFLAEQTAGFLNGFARGALGLVGIRMSTGPLRIASWPGLLFLYTIALVPFAYVVVSPAFRNMDASLEEASRMSGAGPARTALRISLPVIGPAILSAALLVLIIAAAMYSIPAIIGTSARIPTISVYIVNLTLESAAGLSRAVAAALVLVVFITSAWLVQRWITQRQKQMTITGKSTRGAIVRLGRWRRRGRGRGPP
jgi:ABC-type Fe3+ transport system permease subunit